MVSPVVADSSDVWRSPWNHRTFKAKVLTRGTHTWKVETKYGGTAINPLTQRITWSQTWY